MNKWLSLLNVLAPIVLVTVPGGAAFAPLVSTVIHGISEAQQIAGASGPEKKAHVLALVQDSVNVSNVAAAAAGKAVPFDPAAINATASVAIDAVVSTVNAVHAAHDQLAA